MRFDRSKHERAHPSRARLSEGGGAGVDRRSGRGDVVDQDGLQGRRADRCDNGRASETLPSRGPALAAEVAAAQQRLNLEAGRAGKRAGDLRGRIEAAPGQPQRRRRDRDEDGTEEGRGSASCDQRSAQLGGHEEAGELQRVDESAARTGVREGRVPGVDPVRSQPAIRRPVEFSETTATESGTVDRPCQARPAKQAERGRDRREQSAVEIRLEDASTMHQRLSPVSRGR